jgi:hypothetical protein
MRAVGMSHDEIAVSFARRYRLRPRAANRAARGWTQQQAANHINAHAARIGLDSHGLAPMTGPRLSELEHWPLPAHRRRPTPQILALLADVYGCNVHSLLDLDNLEKLPPADLLLLDTVGRSTDHGDSVSRNVSRAPSAVSGSSLQALPSFTDVAVVSWETWSID